MSSDQQKNKFFWDINQRAFTELLTFIDFVDHKLNIGLVEINFAQDRDLLIEALVSHHNCQDIQFKVLNFPDPKLRFLRDELVTALKQIKIPPGKKLILLITGLEKSIGVLGEYPDVVVNLNFIRDDLRATVPHPILFFLPDYALTRMAKYAPDFWAWNRKVFYFKTVKKTLDLAINKTIYSDRSINSLEILEKQERISLLLSLLSEYRLTDKQESKQNLPTLINIYTQLSIAYHTIGEYRKSIKYSQQSLITAKQIGDRHGVASSLNNLGNAYNSLGEYQRAIDFHQKSLKIKREIGDRHGVASSLNNLGNAYNCLGEYQRAIDFHQKSLKIKREIGDRNGEANSLNNLGNAYDSQREYQQAINYLQQSLKIFQQVGDRNGEANSLNNLGNAYDSLGKHQWAINYCQQSLKIFQQIGDRHGEANSLGNLSNAYDSLGEYQQAINYLQQSLEIFQQIGDRHGEANSLGNLSNAYNSLGEYQRAIDFHQQSLEIFQQIGDRHGEAISLNNLGNTRHNMQQKPEAKTAYENARQPYQGMKLDQDVEDCNQAIKSLEDSDNDQ